MTGLWWWIIGASVAAWATKLAGLSLPATWTENERVARMTTMLPTAMLAGLAAVAVVDGGGRWTLDPALLLGCAVGGGVVVTGRGGVLGAFLAGTATTAGVRLVVG